MQQPIPQLEDYGIRLEYGFLPPELPSIHLSDAYYSSWEDILANLSQLISAKQLRRRVNDLRILSTSKLKTESEWQRSYTLLCFIAHSYIWGDDPPVEKVPPSISIPLLEVSNHLGMLPVITYSALCLWNFRPLQNQNLGDPDNLVALHTFTGSADESWFYVNSVAVEAHGAPIIQHLLNALKAVRKEDIAGVTANLSVASAILGELGPLLERVNEHLSPRIFYHDIRPFLAGSRDLPKGVIYEDGSGREGYHRYGGGSAAQSSLIPFCDIVLGIQHSEENVAFVKEMRRYMPACHRRFLEDVAAVANVRDFVKAHPLDSALQTAFKSCHTMLRVFRDKHVNVVTRYIVIPAKAAASAKKLRDGSEIPKKSGDKNMTGTAGAPLIPFLKGMRNDVDTAL